jgi:hypothetical protein
MVAYQPATTASLRLAGVVADNVGIAVSGGFVVESVVVIAVVPVEVSEENVAVRGEERGVMSDFSVTHESRSSRRSLFRLPRAW